MGHVDEVVTLDVHAPDLSFAVPSSETCRDPTDRRQGSAWQTWGSVWLIGALGPD